MKNRPMGRPKTEGQGLDWAKIREDYEARATPEELDGPFDAKGNLKGSVVYKSRATPGALTHAERARMATRVNRTPPAKRKEIVELYKQGLFLTQIGKEAGVAQSTVTRVLEEDLGRKPRERFRKAGTQ